MPGQATGRHYCQVNLHKLILVLLHGKGCCSFINYNAIEQFAPSMLSMSAPALAITMADKNYSYLWPIKIIFPEIQIVI